MKGDVTAKCIEMRVVVAPVNRVGTISYDQQMRCQPRQYPASQARSSILVNYMKATDDWVKAMREQGYVVLAYERSVISVVESTNEYGKKTHEVYKQLDLL